MKYLFSFVFIFPFFLSFGQMNYNEFQKIINFKLDDFELYATTKGYELHSFESDSLKNGVTYSKGDEEKEIRFLTLFDLNKDGSKLIEYLTLNTVEVINFKKELINLKYAPYESVGDDGIKIGFYFNGFLSRFVRITSYPPNGSAIYASYLIEFTDSRFLFLH